VLIDRDRSLLLIVDVQERLVPAIHEGGRVIEGIEMLMTAARRLGVPVLCSEQYPKGLGPTVPVLRDRLNDPEIHAKTAFSCAADPGIAAAVAKTRRRQIVICGVEAHVCVLQSAIGFRETGHEVFVVRDAVSSRAPASVAAALDRLAASGGQAVTREMVFFEWLGAAGTEEFRDLRSLVS
jgi:nicotinamidase-related amidase